MKVSLELAANYFEVKESYLRSKRKYSKYIQKNMFDMDRYIADQQQEQDDCFEYEDLESETPASYIPLDERKPLEASFIKQEYWTNQKTTSEIAKELNVPEDWVQKEIKRLGLGKKENGIKRKGGHKGKVMSQEQRKKRQNQPHAKPIVQICPKTYRVVKEYSSQGAVERCGFLRENVRRAIKTCGLHKGYLWAFKDFKEATIKIAQKREALIRRKLQAYEYKRPTKKQLEQLYIIQNKTLKECADIFKCAITTVAILAGKYGLKKRTEKISIEQLRYLRVEKNLSAKEIAQKMGCSQGTIRTYLCKNKIIANSVR